MLCLLGGLHYPAAAQPETGKAEASVKPGINAEFLEPNLDISQWVERFEGEGREIYVKRQAIVQAAKIAPGAIVADIGAGTGLFTSLLAAATGAKGKVLAVDIVPAFLKLIEERAKSNRVSNVQTVLCTERSVQLAANSIDVAFICDTYHHFEYPQHTLASLFQALRPGGEIFLVDFKRVAGSSSAWILDHVRAGKEVFAAEIEAAGFKQVEEVRLLRNNYILRFQKPAR